MGVTKTPVTERTPRTLPVPRALWLHKHGAGLGPCPRCGPECKAGAPQPEQGSPTGPLPWWGEALARPCLWGGRGV